MSYAGFGPQGGEGIVQSAIDPLTGEVLTERRWIWSGTGGKFPEGPHLYRIGDWWYLLIAEGGTETRARRDDRPRAGRRRDRSRATRPTRSSPTAARDLPVQNTGHADLVQRPDGSWAIVYHGVRARGSSPEWHVLGRETFADEVAWEDGWPVLTGPPRARRRPRTPWSARSSTGERPPAGLGRGVRASRRRSSRVQDGGWRVTAAAPDAGLRRPPPGAPVRPGPGPPGRHGRRRVVGPHRPPARARPGGAPTASVRAVWAVGDVRHELGRAELTGAADLELRVLPDGGAPVLHRPRARTASSPGSRRDGAFTRSARWTGGTCPPRSPAG